MAPIFKDWCFEASRRISQDFIWDTNKKIRIHALKTKRPIDFTKPLLNGFSNRISSMRIDFKGVLLNNLERKPAGFSNLTSLDLESVKFSNDSLLMLAPQLEKLRLAYMKKQEFDLSSINSESMAFSKLRNLILIDIHIDLKKILTKCCHTLKSMELIGFHLNTLEQELTCLNYLSISPGRGVSDQMSNLLTKCSGSLRTLKLDFFETELINLSSLLKQTMKITTLVMEYEGDNLDQFLSKCPQVQNLTLRSYRKAIDDVVLKDLRKLNFDYCQFEFVISFLKNASSLKTLYLANLHSVQDLEFPVIPELDTVWIYYGSRTEMEQVSKLFPNNVQVMSNLCRIDIDNQIINHHFRICSIKTFRSTAGV